MADFISWQDQLNLTGEQEQQLLDKAMAEAEATRGQARRALEQSADEAGGAQNREAFGGGVATTTISGTGSYRDYLRLKTKAAEQALAAQRGGGAVSNLVRRQRAQQSGVNEAWTQQGDELEARQAQLSAASERGAAATNRAAGEERARAAAKAEAERARSAAGDKAQQAYLTALVRGAKGRAAAGGTQRDYVGGYNPYASSEWAQQQGGWEAAQAQNVGATDEQLQGIWDSYTRKGEFGSGQVPGQQSDYMKNAMDPWKKK